MTFILTHEGHTYTYDPEVGGGECTRNLLVEAQQGVPETSLDESGDE